MKKNIYLLLAITLMLSLTACGENEEQKEQNESENAGIVQVDEGLLNVDVTLAATFFEDMTEEEIKKKAEEEGYKDCKINEDGSVTYTMTKKKRQEMLDEMKDSIKGTIAGVLDGEEKVESFIYIEHNDDFSKFDIYVDSEKYTIWDSLYSMTFFVAGAYYQSFAGVPSEEIDVVVNFVDNETQEVLDTSSYGNFMNSINAGSGEQ